MTSNRQKEYLKWKEQIARPYLLERDGDRCNCCMQWKEQYDIDHIKSVGSHPELKRDLDNMQLLCRFPCHRNKTDHIKCEHTFW